MKKSLSRDEILYMLTEAEIRPSMQRLAILEYILSCDTHPSAENIYSHLVTENPTLSRTTVFSSVKLLAEKGLINEINIAGDSNRYDSLRHKRHPHFICRECNRIFDIPMDISSLAPPSEYLCDNVNLYFKGLCPECRKKINPKYKQK